MLPPGNGHHQQPAPLRPGTSPLNGLGFSFLACKWDTTSRSCLPGLPHGRVRSRRRAPGTERQRSPVGRVCGSHRTGEEREGWGLYTRVQVPWSASSEHGAHTRSARLASRSVLTSHPLCVRVHVHTCLYVHVHTCLCVHVLVHVSVCAHIWGVAGVQDGTVWPEPAAP